MSIIQSLFGGAKTPVTENGKKRDFDISEIHSQKALKALAEVNLILSSIDIQELLIAFREAKKPDLLVGVKDVFDFPKSALSIRDRTVLNSGFLDSIEKLPGFAWIKRAAEKQGLFVGMSDNSYEIYGQKFPQIAFVITQKAEDLKTPYISYINAVVAGDFYYEDLLRGPLGSGRPKQVRKIGRGAGLYRAEAEG